MSQTYRTTPDLTDRMPPGIPYIVGNEASERFSFYGMKAILVVYMTQHLLNLAGEPAPMSDPIAKTVYHLFTMSAYAFPILGAIISDWRWGKYRTILWLSIVYCFGHIALASSETRLGLAVGLMLIAVGAGGIKPCTSAHVGDQFGAKNQHLLPRVFSWFYFSINLGAALSSLLTPFLLAVGGPWLAAKIATWLGIAGHPAWMDRLGIWLAFGVPALLMFVSTFVFWLGRNTFVHVPPGGRAFLRESFSGEGLGALGRLTIVFLFVVPFWSLFDQTGSSWVLQAAHMNCRIALPGLNFELLPSQIQAANPFLILVLIPLFAYVIYPLMGKFFEPTALRKIAIGLFISAAAFVISAWIEMQIQAGGNPHILWQLLAYVVITVAEVLVSITCLEFSYTQAPPRMKSLVMAFFLLSIAGGNLVTAGVNGLIAWSEGSVGVGHGLLQGAAYYWFFAGMMLATAIGFLFVLQFYRGKTYIQGESPALTET